MAQLNKYELNERQFERFRKLISAGSGIYIDHGMRELLEQGLTQRVEETGVHSLEDYYSKLTETPDRELEFRHLLSQLSIQDTQFFQNLPQFDALRKYVIGEIIERKLGAGNRNIRFWSAGCSTGQEPFSIAISLLDVLDKLGQAGQWNIQVLGTDLNENAISLAREGWYSADDVASVEAGYLDRFFTPENGGFSVKKPVRDIVDFTTHNMVTDPMPVGFFGTCDVVFCRNVMIYFTHETARYMINHFYDILNPGGYLFLGHSETLWKMSARYSLVELGDTFLYKKTLPRSLEGKRFIPDRRMRDMPLPPGVDADRRLSKRRRG